MTQILILEDDPAIAQTLLYALKKEGWEVLWADTLQQAMMYLSQAKEMSALILDVGLPDGTGFAFCQSVRAGEHFSDVPILFLTARTEEVERVLGFELGADDYIPKPFSPREVVARIKAIFRRQAPKEEAPKSLKQDSASFSKTIANNTWTYQAEQYRLSLNGVVLPLSKTELLIMLALLGNQTHILSREQLLAKVSDYPEHRLNRTVDAHIKSLRQKIGAICSDEIIVTHRGIGYGLALD